MSVKSTYKNDESALIFQDWPPVIAHLFRYLVLTMKRSGALPRTSDWPQGLFAGRLLLGQARSGGTLGPNFDNVNTNFITLP